MDDFDIASFREHSSNSTINNSLSFLQKRKLLGLDDSDSDSDSNDDDIISISNKRKIQKVLEKANETLQDDNLDNISSSLTPESSFLETKIKDSISSDIKNIVTLDDEESEDEKEDKKKEGSSSTLTTTSIPIIQQQQKPTAHIETIDLDSDDEDLDPELIKMAEQDNTDEINSYGSSATSPPQRIEIKVQFVNLQETVDPQIRAVIDMLCKPVKVYIMDNDRFETLLSSYCKKKRLVMDNMILVHDKIPVVLRATPASLSMPSGVTNIMKVYNKKDYEKKIQMEQAAKEALLNQLNHDSFNEEEYEDDGEDLKNGFETTKDDGRFIIKLRGKDKRDVTLRIKPTTSMESIAKEYIRVLGLDSGLIDKIQLSFEGEVFSFATLISDTDLEDQDLVSVDIR